MRYGIYEDFVGYSAPHTTTVDEAKARLMACDLAVERGGSWSVYQLGPQTPDRLESRMSFKPRLVYSCKYTRQPS